MANLLKIYNYINGTFILLKNHILLSLQNLVAIEYIPNSPAMFLVILNFGFGFRLEQYRITSTAVTAMRILAQVNSSSPYRGVTFDGRTPLVTWDNNTGFNASRLLKMDWLGNTIKDYDVTTNAGTKTMTFNKRNIQAFAAANRRQNMTYRGNAWKSVRSNGFTSGTGMCFNGKNYLVTRGTTDIAMFTQDGDIVKTVITAAGSEDFEDIAFDGKKYFVSVST